MALWGGCAGSLALGGGESLSGGSERSALTNGETTPYAVLLSHRQCVFEAFRFHGAALTDPLRCSCLAVIAHNREEHFGAHPPARSPFMPAPVRHRSEPQAVSVGRRRGVGDGHNRIGRCAHLQP